MHSAGEDCSDVEGAYYDVVDEIGATQGIVIGEDVDVYHFWYFNSFDEYSSSVADGDINGVSNENRDYIRSCFEGVEF
jgi:hypothetical protein